MELDNKTIMPEQAVALVLPQPSYSRPRREVVVAGRRTDRLHALVEKITDHGGKAAYVVGDLMEDSYAQALVDFTLQKFGCLDGAFNNAGIVGEVASVGADVHRQLEGRDFR